MGADTKKQHYVPRFLLRNFISNGGKGKHLFVYEKRTGKTFRTSPENIAHENWFYKIGDNCYENEFAELESEVAPIIKKIIQEESIRSLTLEERVLISKFTIIQFTRTRGAVDDYKNTLLLPSLRWGIKKLIEHGKIPPHPKGLDIDDIPLEINDDYAKASVLSIGAQSTLKYSETLALRKWVLFECGKDETFIIGDNPVILDNQTGDLLGLMVPGIEIYIPLSSSYLLGILERNNFFHPNQKWKCIHQIMMYFNSRQVMYSESHLFSSTSKWRDCKNFLSKYPKYKAPFSKLQKSK